MREDGIVSASLNEEERQFEATLRPHKLADFAGQSKVKENLAIAIEAAEQSERLSIPVIDPLQRLDSVLATWPAERQLLVALERSWSGAPCCRCSSMSSRGT